MKYRADWAMCVCLLHSWHCYTFKSNYLLHQTLCCMRCLNFVKADRFPCEHEFPSLWVLTHHPWLSSKCLTATTLMFTLVCFKAVDVENLKKAFSPMMRTTKFKCGSQGCNPIQPNYLNTLWRWAAYTNRLCVSDICRGLEKEAEYLCLHWSAMPSWNHTAGFTFVSCKLLDNRVDTELNVMQISWDLFIKNQD